MLACSGEKGEYLGKAVVDECSLFIGQRTLAFAQLFLLIVLTKLLPFELSDT